MLATILYLQRELLRNVLSSLKTNVCRKWRKHKKNWTVKTATALDILQAQDRMDSEARVPIIWNRDVRILSLKAFIGQSKNGAARKVFNTFIKFDSTYSTEMNVPALIRFDAVVTDAVNSLLQVEQPLRKALASNNCGNEALMSLNESIHFLPIWRVRILQEAIKRLIQCFKWLPKPLLECYNNFCKFSSLNLADLSIKRTLSSEWIEYQSEV